MDGPTIQARVYAGYAKAAKVIGLPFNLYRPMVADDPLGNLVGTIKAAMDSTPSYKFRKPNEYGDATWYALIDDATTQAGDYLINANGTYFIAGKQFLLPVIVVECNRAVHITRQQAVTAVGAVGYSGSVPAQDVDVIGTPGAMWPASILFGGKSQVAAGLPADVKNSGWRILLPPSVPSTIMAGDIVTDDLGKRYAIDGAELTDLGWRLNAQEVHT
jgi:hypothetical protein